MNIEVKTITTEDKSQIFSIREQVFVEEQHVPPDLEIDEHEDEATHFIALVDARPAGTARLRWKDRHTAKAERVAVLKEYRGYGIGKALMCALEQEAKRRQATSVELHAQTHARLFYEHLGYRAYGDVFLDAGIEHIAMEKDLS